LEWVSGGFYERININGNNISYNNTDGWGGGICCIRTGDAGNYVIINDNVITYNKSIYGGGIHCGTGGYSEIKNNIVEHNESDGSSDEGGGAGIHITEANETIIRKNSIMRNDEKGSGWGGGIYCFNTGMIIDNNRISKNTSYIGGSGIYYHGENIVNRIIVNNLVVENRIKLGGYQPDGGAGILVGDGSSPIIINNTISYNVIHGNPSSTTAKGGGLMLISSSPEVINTIVYFNKYGDGGAQTEIEDDGLATPNVTYCCVRGDYGLPGDENIPDDPEFVPGDGFYHIPLDSECVDHNPDNQNPNLPLYDFEGDPRVYPAGREVDIGWDEYVP